MKMHAREQFMHQVQIIVIAQSSSTSNAQALTEIPPPPPPPLQPSLTKTTIKKVELRIIYLQLKIFKIRVFNYIEVLIN